MSLASPSTLWTARHGRLDRVAERRSGRHQTAREAESKGSRGIAPRIAGIRGLNRAALAVLAAGAVAGVLMIATEFSPVATVKLQQDSCEVAADPSIRDRCSLSGFERHGGAYVLLGIFTLTMAYGAGVGGSRPAAVALVGAGAIVLGLTLISDLPQTTRTGAIGPRFTEATAGKGIGFWFELVAGLLAVSAGLLSLQRASSRPP